MSRIRHATETFVNHLIEGVKKLIKSNTEQINVLSSDRGYINSKEMKDFNACVKNGKYTVYFNGDGVAQHAPPSIWAGDNTFSVDVTQQSDTVLVQEICGIYGPNQGRKFYRVNTFGTWTDWKEIATTSKTDISSSSLLNGWTMWGNGYGDNLVGCKTGKQVQLNGLLRCGVKTQNTLIVTLPQELRPTCSIIKNVSCYPYGTATIEIQSVGNVLVGNIGEGTLAISMGDVSYFTL